MGPGIVSGNLSLARTNVRSDYVSVNQQSGIQAGDGSARSTTRAGISGIAGNVSARTGDAETGLKPIFDAQIAITQEFGSLLNFAALWQQSKPPQFDGTSQRMAKINPGLRCASAVYLMLSPSHPWIVATLRCSIGVTHLFRGVGKRNID